MSKIKLSLSDTKHGKYQNPVIKFNTSLKSPHTKKAYTKTFHEFLKSVSDFQGTFEEKAIQFFEHSQNNIEDIEKILESYAIQLNERSKEPHDSDDYLNPSVFSNKFKGIKKFCKVNRILIHWDIIDEYSPEQNNVKHTRGFTTDEVKIFLDNSTSIQTDFMILAISSCGARAGEWEELHWEHISPIYCQGEKYSFDSSEFDDSGIVCACVIIYAGTPSEYRTLISIEAWDKLQALNKQRTQKLGNTLSSNDYVFLTKRSPSKFSVGGVRQKLSTIVHESKTQVKINGERRCESPATHGFRKRWNKIMTESENKNDSHGNHIRKERLMGHKVGISSLEGNYFYTNILESVPQYLQAMPELMISEEYRTQIKLQLQKEKNNQLQAELKKNTVPKELMDELLAKIERLEKYQKVSDV